MESMLPLILASASPRRQELLARLGQPFEVMVSDSDEDLPQDMAPEQVVAILAERKALAVAKQLTYPARVLGADTVVALGQRRLGKPVDEADAVAMLMALQNGWHRVLTGICLWTPEGIESEVVTTQVHMMPISEAEIQAYVATGDPMDKAGAYGIQGWAGAYIDRIEGCYYNVMGLPLAQVRVMLEMEGGNHGAKKCSH